MAITISSTTDTQEQVNAAAGVEAVEEAPVQTPPAEAGRPVPDDDPDEDDPEDDGPEEEEEKPGQPPPVKKKGGWLRKIEALERDKGYAARYIQELEQALAQRAGAPSQQQNGHQQHAPEQPPGRPSQDQFQTYEEYVEALTDWKVNARLEREREQYAAYQQRKAEQDAVQGFQQRAVEYSKIAPDYFETMQSVEHIPVSPALKQALVESDLGPAVAYELARNPEDLARITRLAPIQAAREIGRIEARIQQRTAPEQRKTVPAVRPPEPIRPVGQSAGGNSKVPLDEMSYQDFKRAREKQIAASKRR